jgi:hypothetical protein
MGVGFYLLARLVPTMIEEVRFATDSTLEEASFEPSDVSEFLLDDHLARAPVSGARSYSAIVIPANAQRWPGKFGLQPDRAFVRLSCQRTE